LCQKPTQSSKTTPLFDDLVGELLTHPFSAADALGNFRNDLDVKEIVNL
jgi:hypothetical protein